MDNKITEEKILKYLNTKDKFNMIILDTVDSTNTYAKKISESQSIDNLLIVSDEQSKGRGRCGRDFYSPKDNGIYMTVSKEVNCDFCDLNMVTIKTAVAVSKALEKVSGITTGIKWVNDIYLSDKKICGILVEAVTDYNINKVKDVIIGIGINVKSINDFPDDLKGKVDALNINLSLRCKIIAEILNNFHNIFEDNDDIFYYRKKSVLIGKGIIYEKNNNEYYGFVEDINDFGNLIVKNEKGNIEIIKSGEVKITKIK